MFKIGDFSKLCRIPVSALRYYADIDLLKPAYIDEFTGYRYYSLEQLPRLNRIIALKDLGLSLTEVKSIIEGEAELNIHELRGMLKLKQVELQHELDQRQAQLDRVAARLQQIEQEGKMPEQEVILKDIDVQTVLSLRYIAENPMALGEMLGKVYPALFGQGIMPISAPGTVYHDEEFHMENIDVEIIYPVSPDTSAVKVSDDLSMTPRELPAIQAASIIHKGSYDSLPNSYTAIGQWIEKNGYTITGAARELYLSSPDDADGAITEIQFPIQKA